MNYDDLFTRDSEKRFQDLLAKARKFPQEYQQIMEDYLLEADKFLKDFNAKSAKSSEDIEMFHRLTLFLPQIMQCIADMKLLLDESLYRKSRAYYENVKNLAKEGNKEAERIYLDLKSDFESFDLN